LPSTAESLMQPDHPSNVELCLDCLNAKHRMAAAALKARDELAALGLDGGPRQPNNSNYPRIG